MASILLFIQHSNGKVLKGTLAALQAARELQSAWGASGIVGIALGPQSMVAAESMVAFGLSSVRYSEDALFEKYRAEPYARAIALAARELGASSVVGLASSSGKDSLPRVAALLDAAQASDIIGVNPDGSIRRPMYAGNVIADVELVASTRVITVRGTGFAPAGLTIGGGDVAQASFFECCEICKGHVGVVIGGCVGNVRCIIGHIVSMGWVCESFRPSKIGHLISRYLLNGKLR